MRAGSESEHKISVMFSDPSMAVQDVHYVMATLRDVYHTVKAVAPHGDCLSSVSATGDAMLVRSCWHAQYADGLL